MCFCGYVSCVSCVYHLNCITMQVCATDAVNMSSDYMRTRYTCYLPGSGLVMLIKMYKKPNKAIYQNQRYCNVRLPLPIHIIHYKSYDLFINVHVVIINRQSASQSQNYFRAPIPPAVPLRSTPSMTHNVT